MSDIVPFRNVMPKEEFGRRWADFLATYGPDRKTAAARSEQAMGELFEQTHWTQEEIAAEIGMTQGTVARLLVFGAFLAFIPAGINANFAALRTPLTERRFRQFWSATKDMAGNERQRYTAVWKALLADDQNRQAGGRKTPRDFGAIRAEIGKRFADENWHSAKKIAEALDIDDKTLADVVAGSRKFRLTEFPYEIEPKIVGSSIHYKFWKLDRHLSLRKALLELSPIHEALQKEARKSNVTVSVSAIARMAQQLTRLIERWEESSRVMESSPLPGSRQPGNQEET